MAKRLRAPLTLPDYERVFRTIHAVLANEEGDLSKSCLFFGIAGALILDLHHGLKTARPIVGAASYDLRTPTKLTLAFGSIKDGALASAENGFHCWIEVDDWIIDFAAPLFDAMAPSERKGAQIRPLMFQKPVSGGARTTESLQEPGAYLHIPNPVLTQNLIPHFLSKQSYADLVTICAEWYARPPKKMQSVMRIGNQHGEVTEVRLSSIRVEGAW
jgi:hypothetical protein